MCRFPASGSSWKSFARGGVAHTIRDSAVKKVSKVGSPPCFRSCQFSYPLSFRGQFCETQVLAHVSWQRFSPHGTPLSSISCRTAALGGHVARCQDCPH